MEELYGTRYQSGSFSLINVGSGIHCLRSFSFLFYAKRGLHRCGPECFYQFSGSCPWLRSLHTRMCVYQCHSSLRGCHTAAPSRSWNQWLRQTSRPHCSYTLIWLNKKNWRPYTVQGLLRIHSNSTLECSHVVIWWSELSNPEGKGYQWNWPYNLLNNTFIDTLNCQPTELLYHTSRRCQRLGVTNICVFLSVALASKYPSSPNAKTFQVWLKQVKSTAVYKEKTPLVVLKQEGSQHD